MQKENVTKVIHPVFGTIEINKKFAEVLELSDFQELRFKSQLGTKALSKFLLNATHNRLMHSIGVMYVTRKLIDICERKFTPYLTITQEEKEAMELAALGHDLKHLAFSHSLQILDDKSHEDRTIEYFEEHAEEINKIFGYDIVSKVIYIYKKDMAVKKYGYKMQREEGLNILEIYTNLLIGAIDCDRIEYLMSDCHLVYGREVDYTKIFQYITIELMDDKPVIAFEEKGTSQIENLLLTRLDNILECYLEKDGDIIEKKIGEYILLEGWGKEKIRDVTQFEILAELKKILSDENKKDTIQYRIAEVVLRSKRKNILYKEFKDVKEYEYFLERLYTLTPRRDIIKTKQKRVTVYNPAKDRIYIKCEDGIIRDFLEVSNKIKGLSVDFGSIMVDIDPIYGINEKEAEIIKELFEDSPIEIEKKFVFPERKMEEGYITIEEIQEILGSIPHVEQSKYWEILENNDLYFEATNNIPKNIAIRYRKEKGIGTYYVKISADDETSITKREEHKFKNCKSKEEFIKLVTKLFEAKKIELNGELELIKGVKIVTNRKKTLIKIKDSIIEVSCDFSTYKYNGKIAEDNMLECELKQGEDIALWYLTKYLNKFGFVETNESKQSRAKKALNIE